MNIFNIFSIEFWRGMLYSLPGIIIALSFHEFAHAYVANKMGDNTAKNLGRLTLNPAAHLDPIGFIALILLGFGWAKPVPVNPRNYRGNKKRADILVSIAGVVMNLCLAIIFMLLTYLLFYVIHFKNDTIITILQTAVWINLSLMVFNLIPVPPLDGSHIAEDLLISRLGPEPFIFLRRYGTFILLALLFMFNSSGLLRSIIGSIYNGLTFFFNLIFGVG